jgi:alpha-L-fucosidase
MAGSVSYASFVHDASAVRFKEIDGSEPAVPHERNPGPVGSLVLELPIRRPDVQVPVIELILTDVPRLTHAHRADPAQNVGL